MKRHALRVSIAAALLVIGGALALVFIGRKVEHELVHTPLPPAQVAPAQSCAGIKATMSCVLQHQAPPASTARSLSKPVPGASIHLGSTTATTSASATSIYGVDFGWSTLSASGLSAIHARFAASYLGADVSKNWTLAAVDADHASGIATVAVLENTATRAEEGYAAGVTDAKQAEAQLAALGDPNGYVTAAVDCDCAVASITSYFQGWHSVLGPRGGAYGGYDQILGLHDLGLVGNFNYQTYAWSGGRWLPASIAPLEQYLNGSAYDNDRAIAGNYGQWPVAVVKRTGGGRRHWTWLPDTRRTFHAHGKIVRARERGAVRLWDRDRCLNPARRPTCRRDREHLQLLAGRVSLIAHRTGKHLRHEAKRPRWDAIHYRASHHRTTLGGAYRQLHRRLVKPGHVTAW